MKHLIISHLFRFLLALCLLVTAGAGQAIERVTYYHNDALGSPVAAADGNGTLLWRESYAPYGKRLTQEAGSKHTVWYTGKPEEAAFGLSYFGARWYDPAIGRFLAMDPAGFDLGNIQSFNRYAYANDNPYKYLDPDGNSPLDIGFFIADSIRFAIAVNSGNPAAIQSAAADLAGSAIGLISPVPGTGQLIKGARAGGKLAKFSSGTDRVKYIGKVDDLKGIPRSQTFIDDLPDLGTPRANWKQNSSVIRKAQRDGYKIKDASSHRRNFDADPARDRPGRKIGQSFLGAERNLLNNRGGSFDSSRSNPRRLP